MGHRNDHNECSQVIWELQRKYKTKSLSCEVLIDLNVYLINKKKTKQKSKHTTQETKNGKAKIRWN